MTEPVVEINNLSRQFGRTLALNQVNFTAERGQVYGLVGANGAGKTTLIKHMLGLLRCHSGSVRVFGRDPTLDPIEVLRQLGYLSEERDIPDWMTITELMNYTQAFYPKWDPAYATELLDTFALDPAKQIRHLSRGMRAQVALIAAVAYRPELLILDEPSSGLDAIVRKDILNAIVRTISEEGRTVIFSSHFLEEVERLSDHVTMIQQGRIVLDASLDALRESHHHSQLHFANPLAAAPELAGLLSVTGEGRYWSAVHTCTPEQLNATLAIAGGSVAESRYANLEEIFVSRVGRVRNEDIAA